MQFQVAVGDGGEAPVLVIDQDINPGDIQLAGPDRDEEQLDDFGAPRINGYDCGGNLVKIGVPYRYYSNHGRQVYATAWVIQDSELIAAGWMPVEQSTNGLVQLNMDTRDVVEDGFITERIKLRFMIDPTRGEAFYTEEADLTISWPTPKPDLLITDVVRSINGDSIDVTVHNMGCEDVDGFDLSTITAPDERDKLESYPDTIPAGGAKTVTMRFLDPNLYSYLFEVAVDPEDAIDEIDEGNNIFQKFPIRVKYIHFYKIDIHDTSDGEWHENADEGEFRIYAYAHDQRAIRPSNNLDMSWRMDKGSHDITGIINPIKLSPDINSDQPLVLLVDLEEDDTFGSNDWDKMVFIHSADMNDVDSWKRGHGKDFSATSSNGRFTMHWWIVLEE